MKFITIIQSVWIDRLGFAASFLCAIHCAAMPFVLILFPFLGSGIIASIELEWFMLVVSGLLGYLGVRHGFRKHGLKRVLFFFLLGIIFLLIARLYQIYEMEVLKSNLQFQIAPFLQTVTPPIQSYRYLHALSHKNITFSSLISVLGGVLIAASHLLNIKYGHHIKKGNVILHADLAAENISTNPSNTDNKSL